MSPKLCQICSWPRNSEFKHHCKSVFAIIYD